MDTQIRKLTAADFADIQNRLESYDGVHRITDVTNEEVEALFQHFIDTDTLPDNPQYEVTALILHLDGVIHNFDQDEKRFACAVAIALAIGAVSQVETQDSHIPANSFVMPENASIN